MLFSSSFCMLHLAKVVFFVETTKEKGNFFKKSAVVPPIIYKRGMNMQERRAGLDL